ncbi:MAG: F0F1 ATP synthase subunit B [Treponema sp.]|jgi:F-type H+-transporting ATPase subunit b|nr:F0F1 ATP synthase subunit B [Treponema sp.]
MLDFSVTFFITVINILILFFLLRAFLFKPVSKFIQDRRKKIQDDINRAEKDAWDAKKLLEQYESKLAGAEADAEAIIRAAREDAGAEAEKIREAGKADAERVVAAARVQAENERRAALALFRAEAAALVLSAAGRLLKRELAGEEQLRFARKALEELE